MLRRYWFLGLYFLLGFTAANVCAEISLVDDAGNTVSLQNPARRIISLAPHVTELLYAAGAGEYIVGAVSYSDYPEVAKKLPRIGGYNAFDLEAIMALRPDVVVAWKSGNPDGPVQKLRDLGIPVYFSEPQALEDVAHNLRQLGKLAGTHKLAQAASDGFLAQLKNLRARYQAQQTVSVFYQIWHQPLMTINGEHIISQVISLCGGRNVFAKLPMLAAKISREAVLAENPEVIVGGGVAAANPNWKQDWYQWPRMRAVKNKSLFYINPDLIQRHTPRILQGTEVLCRQLAQVRGARDTTHQ